MVFEGLKARASRLVERVREPDRANLRAKGLNPDEYVIVSPREYARRTGSATPRAPRGGGVVS